MIVAASLLVDDSLSLVNAIVSFSSFSPSIIEAWVMIALGGTGGGGRPEMDCPSPCERLREEEEGEDEDPETSESFLVSSTGLLPLVMYVRGGSGPGFGGGGAVLAGATLRPVLGEMSSFLEVGGVPL